jgi:hypothetical protein
MEMAMMMVLRQLPRNGLVADRRHPKFRWYGQGNARQQSANATDDGQGRGIAGLQNSKQNAAVSILPHDVRLRNAPVAYSGDIVHIDRCAVYLAQRQVADSRKRNRR